MRYILRTTRPRVNTTRRTRRAYVVFALYLRVPRSCKLSPSPGRKGPGTTSALPTVHGPRSTVHGDVSAPQATNPHSPRTRLPVISPVPIRQVLHLSTLTAFLIHRRRLVFTRRLRLSRRASLAPTCPRRVLFSILLARLLSLNSLRSLRSPRSFRRDVTASLPILRPPIHGPQRRRDSSTSIILARPLCWVCGEPRCPLPLPLVLGGYEQW